MLSEDTWVGSGARGRCVPLKCLNRTIVVQRLLSLYTPVASLMQSQAPDHNIFLNFSIRSPPPENSDMDYRLLNNSMMTQVSATIATCSDALILGV